MISCKPQIIFDKKEVYEGCALRKQHREAFPKEHAWRAQEPLELVHTDICGPMKTPSHVGNIYLLNFEKFTLSLNIF